jgi:putative nucleotidyltransferase with HDIG domain
MINTINEPGMNESLRLFTQGITRIPTTPPVASRILELLGSQAPCVNSVVKVIEKDPAISAKVIGLSNSAFFRRGNKVRSISDAVMNIGFDNVKGIALGVSLLTVFMSENEGSREEYENIFRHCLAVGFIAREIDKFISYDGDEDSFTCGLLHDLGLMIIQTYMTDLANRIAQKVGEGRKYGDSEMDILGFTHEEVGAWLADKWNLPENIHAAIYCHHNPAACGQHLHSAAVVHIADQIAVNKGLSPLSAGGFEYPFDNTVLKPVGISKQDIDRIETQVDEILYEIRGTA